ncbi:MAG: hypothetical protein IJO78_07370 [Erysipelotrichaceae bacterium]|nr:hypothetical protein [Erysipelotrichaceae bacterium]
MQKKLLLGATDISNMLGISRSKAYQIIREGNEVLKKQNKLTISGKLPTEYFEDIWYSSKSYEENCKRGE